MQASAGGGRSGAAARAAGPDLLLLRERPEKVCMERVLRESDGLGFCRSSLAGRSLNPTPELSFQYKERDRERERERDSKLYPSTDASCFTDTCPETVCVESAPKLGKGGKKKKSGAARRRRKKERIDASLALFEAEAAEYARIGALAVVARVLHKVRNLSKSVIKWNVWFSNEFARWAAQNAAVAAGWAAEQAEDEAEWAADEARIREKVSKGLVRRVRGKRGVGAGRSRRRRARRKRMEQAAHTWLEWKAEQQSWWGSERLMRRQADAWAARAGNRGSRWRLMQRKRRRGAMGSGIWQQRQRGQAGVREGNAPAGLCRRQGRAVGAGWGRGPRYWRLGGGGKQGWVT